MPKSNIIQRCIEEQIKYPTYTPNEVILLVDTLKSFSFTNVEEKESKIQSGQKHYSEMLSKESLPTQLQKEVFKSSLEQYRERIAKGSISISVEMEKAMKERGKKSIVLVSLIRAGLPLGVCVHTVNQLRGMESYHYGVSIIRDRGLDKVAMNAILSAHPDSLIVFVDGWIGKGAITRQLKESCVEYGIEPLLYTLSDPTNNISTYSPYRSDWLIPFGIMGSVVSGLLSRTIYQEGLHGAIYYESDDFYHNDLTHYFLRRVKGKLDDFRKKVLLNAEPTQETELSEKMKDYLCNEETDYTESDILVLCERIMKDFNVDSLNRVKPSIAEATRAILRRVPEKVLVSDKADPELALLIDLCKEKGVEVELYDTAPYRAITIIKKS